MTLDNAHRIVLEPRLRRYIAGISCDLIGGTAPAASVREMEPGIWSVALTFRLPDAVSQDDWRLRVVPGFQPDFHWAPHLTPTDEHIIDQHSFRSPAILARGSSRLVVMIPDLDMMSRGTPVRWYMDNDARRNELVLGMSRSGVREHVLYVREPGAAYTAGEMQVGFYLMTFDSEEELANPWRPILRWLWEKWGTALFNSRLPYGAPLDKLAGYAYTWAFDSWSGSVWQQFELNGRQVGAPAFIVNTTQSPNSPVPVHERELRSVWNQAWFSSLRSAQGVYRYGLLHGNSDLVGRARMMKELALSAPQTDGLFPSVIATEMEWVEAEGKTVQRSLGWDTAYWGNSNRNPIHPWQSVKLAPYHVLDMSWTALLMLRWHEELERDQRLVDYAARYAETLVKLQDDNGFFPAWLEAATLQTIDILRDSPESSMSVTFLLKLAELTGRDQYAAAALRAMEAVIESVIPVGRWEDFETYWSCSTYANDRMVGKKFARNNVYKQCSFSMFWTAEALLACYRYTGEGRYLQYGQRCLDEMLMYQASWQPPYIHVFALGGFGVMNCDGEWNDARQSLFAELILDYARELGHEEYRERGIAALRSAFVMMYCPENPRTKEQWEKAHPFFNEKDYGFMMENYGHNGEVDANGTGMGDFTIFDWGNGAAAASFMRIKALFKEMDGIETL